jgi:hypothetical protein
MARFASQEQAQRFSMIVQKATIALPQLQTKQCTTILVIKGSSALLQQVKRLKQETIVLKLTIVLQEQVSIITLRTLAIMTIGEQMLQQDVHEVLVMILVILKCFCFSA